MRFTPFLAALIALAVSGTAMADRGPPHTSDQHTETLHIFQAAWRPSGELVTEPLLMTFKVTPKTCETATKFYAGPIHNLTPRYRMVYARWCE